MAIDKASLLDGIGRAARLIELIPSPLAGILGEGLELAAEAVRIATADATGQTDPVTLLRTLRASLRAGVLAEWQTALDKAP